MQPRSTSSALDYRFWLAAGAVALLGGALASIAFAQLLALGAVCALVWVVATRPRASVIALALASPFYDLAVIQVSGIADIRVLEVLWLVAALSLGWRLHTGTETRFNPPPRWFRTALIVFASWFVIAAIASGGGARPFIEALQTIYLCLIAYLVAGVVAATDPPELGHWLRPWAIVLGLVMIVSLAGYLLGFQPVSQVVVRVPGFSIEYLTDSPLLQGAGSDHVQIARLGILNLGPVGSAAIIVSILTIALSVALTRTTRANVRSTWLLLGSGAVVLLLTYSRAGWLLAIAAAALVMLAARHRTAAISLSLFVLALALAAGLPSVASRLEEFADVGEGSYQAHARMWVTAVHMVGERPVFGWGPGTFAEKADSMAINTWMATDISADQPHNWLLEIAAETGIIGSVIAVLFVGTLLVVSWRRIRGAPLPVFGLWVATGTYVTMNLTINAFRTEMMWVWFGALMGISSWYIAKASSARPGEVPVCES
ncbi:MAG: O-antigen ligase family protein [Actinomycetota bacterium]|nr:MAG: Lipid A core--O-antigen ligase-like [Actinomycetota bacterium]MDO8949903.1 O-antigen ligase family protein [Actinomycetota bacterium]MDP3631138.1 O-antigen ligase family protein [Actinomycetota bacterium]